MTESGNPLGSNPANATALPLLPTPELIAELLRGPGQISDLVLAPMRPPQIEVNGRLMAVKLLGLPALAPADTERIAGDLLANNRAAEQKLREDGACDLSYYLPNLASFRASIFKQRGSYAISMRVIPKELPNLAALRLPPQLGEIAHLRNGIVLLTGLAGSGKSSTLAALINAINEERAVQIHTIEDPIEFLHPHKKATILQREVYRDAPSFHVALQAALRHSAEVILVSEMRDRETIELALEAAESGQLVLSALRTTDVAKTLERILGYFPATEQQAVRVRLARNLRHIVSQRLIPRKDGTGREPICEIFISNAKTRGRVEKADFSGKTLTYAMRECANEGMQCFHDTLMRLLHAGVFDLETVREFAGDLLEDPLEPIDRAAAMKPNGGRAG
jgi:twitching motility protein PilT